MPNRGRNLILSQLRQKQKEKYSAFKLPLEPAFGDMNLFEQAMDLLMRPGHTVTGAVRAASRGEDVLGGAWKGLSGQEHASYSDILKDQGVPEGLGRSVVGFVGDVALDPLTYVGVGPVAKAGSTVVKGVSKALTAAGMAKVGEIGGRLESALKRAIPTMSEGKLVETAARASRQAPEARALLRGLSPAELRGEEAIKHIAKGLSAPYVGKALAKTPGLVAENAIKFAGIPLVKTATIGKAAKAGLEAAKKIPLVGRGVQLAETVAKKGAGAARKLLSSSTGNAEIDAIIGAKRDLKNVGQAEAGEFAQGRIKDIAKIGKAGTPAYKTAQEEVIRTIEGVPKKEVVGGVLTESRTPYVSSDPRIAPIAAKLQERTAGILKAEMPTLNLAPQERSFYLPHYMKPEIEGLLKTNPSSILRDNAPAVSNALRRVNRKGVLEYPIDDLIHGGMIDPDKYDKLLKAKGVPKLTADERLVFDPDPVKAVLKREVGSVRARAAAEMRDEIIHSDSFLKSKVDLRSPAGITEAEGQLATHPGHSLYVTTKDWIEHGLDDAGREALRQGKNRDLLKSMMVKIDSESQLAKLAGKAKRVDGFVLPDEIVDHLNAAHVRDFMDEKVADFIRNVYDPALGWWKAFTTVVRPGFISRNGISNVWQNFLAGVKDPTAYLYAGQLQRAAATGQWGKLAKVAGYTDQELYRLAREMGMVKSGQLGQGVEKFVEDATNPSRNPFSRRGPLVRVGGAISGTVEDNAKLANFIDGLRKGMDPKSAAMRAKKYLFDYCVDEETEILTERGWLRFDELCLRDRVFTLNPETNKSAWSEITRVNVFPARSRSMIRMTTSRFDALVTPHHRWITKGCGLRGGHWTIRRARTHFETAQELRKGGGFIVAGGGEYDGSPVAVYTDEFVELVGWVVTEGWYQKWGTGVLLAQSVKHNPQHVERIRKLAVHFKGTGATVTEYAKRDLGWGDIITFYFGKGIGNLIHDAAPEKALRPEFILRLTSVQLALLYRTLMNGDGHVNDKGTEIWAQKDSQRIDGFQMLAALLGKRTHSRLDDKNGCSHITVYKAETVQADALEWADEEYGGRVWCPTTANGTWYARRNGVTYWTGNTDLSSFEQKYLKRILPFYVWSRKNLPLQLETLLKQPGKVALLPKAMQAADKDVDGLDRPVVADWINKSLGIPIKKNEDGTVSYVLMGGLIPTADLARMDTKQLVSMLSPIIKTPIEQLMNEDWFRAKPIVGFPGEMVQFMGVPMPARMAHLIRNLIIVAQVDRGFFQDDRDFLQGMSNLLTGIRTYKQDPVRQLKSYFLRQQKTAGMMENEAERQAGKTSLFGDTVVKDRLLAQAEQLRGRGETARAKALDINPMAFTPQRTTRPQLAPTTAQQFKARVKGQIARMYKKQVASR